MTAATCRVVLTAFALLGAFGFSMPAASQTAPPLAAGKPEPTEEPTTSPSDAIAASAAVGPEWTAFTKIVEAANDFVATVTSHEQTLSSNSTATYKLSSRKPHFARCEIVEGTGAGGVAIWRGGDKVQAHEGGQHKDIIVVLPRHNKHVTDAFGIGCGDTTPDMIVGYSMHNGKLTEAPGPAVGADPTDIVTWVPNPGDQVKADKIEYYISKTTHLLVQSKIYSGAAVVGQAQWSIVVNPGLKYSTFDISQ